MSYTTYEFDSIVEWQDEDIDCTITFEYTPPSKQVHDCPAYDAEVEVASIMIDGSTKDAPAIDIMDLIGSVEFAKLKVDCFEFVKEEDESDAEGLADYKYSMIKDEGMM